MTSKKGNVNLYLSAQLGYLEDLKSKRLVKKKYKVYFENNYIMAIFFIFYKL